MVAHVDAPPKATERVSPYSDTPFPASVATTHLALLVLSPEHIGTFFPGDKIVSSPPLGSPPHGWITSGDPKKFIGCMVQRVLNAQGHHNVCTLDDWKYEILTKTIVIPKSNERLTLFLTQESKGATQKTKGEMPPKTKGERRDDNKRPTKHRRMQKKNNLALMA
jgi:hypothetical protein